MPAAVRRRAAASTSASGSHSAARREASHSGGSSTGGAGSSRGGEADSVRHEQLIRLASIELSGSPSLKDACVQLSPAGQVAFVSPAAIHVLTPAWTLAPPSDTSVQRSVSTVSMRLLPGLEVPTSERSAALSHAAYAAIPIEPLLSRAKDDYDTNRSRSKDYASFPVGLDKLVWKTAAWSPQPFGSLHSPLLAALDSSLRVTVFHARTDPARGPYEVRDHLSTPRADDRADADRSRKDFLRQQISCMAWLPSASRDAEQGDTDSSKPSCYLLAATRSGELVLWRFITGAAAHFVCSVQAAPEPICGLSIGQWRDAADGHSTRIAVLSVSRVHIATVTSGADGTVALAASTASIPFAHQPALSAWAGDALYLTAPGALHRWVPGTPLSCVALGADEAGRGDRLSPAAALVASHGGLDLVLSDGLHYRVSPSLFSAGTEVLVPTKLALPMAHLADESHAVHGLQAAYEAEQGLWALSGPVNDPPTRPDLASLRWAVHRADKLGQFRHARHPTFSVTLLLSTSFDDALSQPSEKAVALLRRQIASPAWNSAARFAPLLAYYYALPQSVRASVSDAVLQELQSRRDTTDAEELRGIIWLSTWLATQSGERDRASVIQTLNDAKRAVIRANLRARLQRIIGALESRKGRGEPHESALFCKRTAAFSLLASLEGSDAQMRSQASKLLQSFLSKAQAKAIEQQWTAEAEAGGGLNTGETCPVCSASVALSLEHADLARCARGHVWSRCSVTLRLLEANARNCSWCGAQAAVTLPKPRNLDDLDAADEEMEMDAPEQHQDGSELSELQRQSRCGICGGPWCVPGS